VANVPSAEKRNRQRGPRRQRNLMHLTKVRTSVKKVRASLAAKDGKAAGLLKIAIRLIDKAAQKGVIKKTTASRHISRLQKTINVTK
jgi:small subunit ribosomal protein S20